MNATQNDLAKKYLDAVAYSHECEQQWQEKTREQKEAFDKCCQANGAKDRLHETLVKSVTQEGQPTAGTGVTNP